MRWPWVSRRAYDDMRESRDVYREALREHILRAMGLRQSIERAEAGLPERPREPKEPDPMPSTLRAKCMKFGSAVAQQNMISLCERAYALKKNWVIVEREFDAGLAASRVQDEEPT